MEIKYLIKFGSCMRGHEILVPSPNVFNHCAVCALLQTKIRNSSASEKVCELLDQALCLASTECLKNKPDFFLLLPF